MVSSELCTESRQAAYTTLGSHKFALHNTQSEPSDLHPKQAQPDAMRELCLLSSCAAQRTTPSRLLPAVTYGHIKIRHHRSALQSSGLLVLRGLDS